MAPQRNLPPRGVGIGASWHADYEETLKLQSLLAAGQARLLPTLLRRSQVARSVRLDPAVSHACFLPRGAVSGIVFSPRLSITRRARYVPIVNLSVSEVEPTRAVIAVMRGMYLPGVRDAEFARRPSK